MTEYRVLNAATASLLGNMTFPSYRHLLDLQPNVRHQHENDPRQIQPLAIGAVSDNALVGLALIELPLNDSKSPEILSLFVDAARRRQGIATGLVQAAEEELRRRGFADLDAVYMTGKPSVEYIEKIFAKLGWNEPETRMVSCRFTMDDLRHATWLDKYKLSSDYEIFSWVDLKPEEREELITSQQKLQWIASDLQPWDYEKAGFDPVTSVGMRYKGKVVGWVINHQLNDETIRYTCSFIHKSLGRLGRILPLYSESFRRTIAAGYRYGTFVTPLYHRGMAAFAKRWFGPWASYLGETRGSLKQLRNHPAPEQNQPTHPVGSV
jgi:GNAT superfamily N-acetyltransferase